MTGDEWLNCTDPKLMLEFVRGKASDRKLRLFACAFVTERYGLDTAVLGDAIRKAERWADGEPPGELGELAQCYVCFPSAWQAAEEGTVGYVENWGEGSLKKRFTLFLAETLRCICGFRVPSPNPDWLTSAVLALATGIYSDRAFDRLPILADALQDAGCDNADILDHCRSEGPHVRGCWVVDSLLGKS